MNLSIFYIVALLLLILLIIGLMFFRTNTKALLSYDPSLYKSFILSNPIPILSLDVQGKILHINRAAEHLFVCTTKEASGRILTDLLKTKDSSLLLIALHKALKGIHADCTIHGTDHFGNKLVLKLTFIPMVKNAKLGVFMMAEDCSHKENMESILQQTNERLISFVTHTTDAITITTLDGRLLYVNPAFERMYGWSKQELIGKPLPIIPDYLRSYQEMVKDSLLQGNPIQSLESTFLRKDGSSIDVNISVSPLRDSNGVINGFAMISRDETERKAMERSYQKIAKHYSSHC